MIYSIEYTCEPVGDGKTLKVTWEEAMQGSRSVPVWFRKDVYKSIPMTRAEAETFQEMERMDLTKNIEPDRIFLIKYAWD